MSPQLQTDFWDKDEEEKKKEKKKKKATTRDAFGASTRHLKMCFFLSKWYENKIKLTISKIFSEFH